MGTPLKTRTALWVLGGGITLILCMFYALMITDDAPNQTIDWFLPIFFVIGPFLMLPVLHILRALIIEFIVFPILSGISWLFRSR
jgi:hypothetical protein